MVEGIAQRAAPLLVPARAPASRASAIAVPAAYAVSAAPGTSFAVEILEHHFVLRRELFQEPSVVYRDHVVVGSVVVVQPGGAHVAERLVVTVAFAVGADAYELRVFTVRVPGVPDTVAEGVRVAQQVFEPYGRREPRVVEKYVKITVTDEIAFLVARVDAVGAGRVDIGVAASRPFCIAELAEFVGLRGRKDGELDARLDEFHHGIEVDGGLGEPHGFGHAAKVELEIFDAPADLRALVMFACERHDDVVVHLGNGVAVAVQPFHAPPVGFLDAAVGIRRVCADPSHQGWTHVETHEIVVVDNIDDTPLRAQDTASRIRAITFTCDAVVPVVKGACARLVLDNARPRIFTRRLVKVTVNRKVEGMLVFHTPKDRKLYFTRIFWA